MDVILSILAIIAFIVLLVVVLIGINLMFQWVANLSGRRHVVKVNGATLFDVKPESKNPSPYEMYHAQQHIEKYREELNRKERDIIVVGTKYNSIWHRK